MVSILGVDFQSTELMRSCFKALSEIFRMMINKIAPKVNPVVPLPPLSPKGRGGVFAGDLLKSGIK
jgi:hypothetical protein